MIWIGIILGSIGGIYLVHCVGGIKLPKKMIPTVHWFREIRFPNARSWRPKDKALLTLRCVLVSFLISLWLSRSCQSRNPVVRESNCLLAIDDSWSTHANWSEIERAVQDSQRSCQPRWVWWTSQSSPSSTPDLPKEAGYLSKALSPFLLEVQHWAQSRRDDETVTKLVLVTDGQLHPREARSDIDRAIESVQRLGIQVEVIAKPPPGRQNTSVAILGNTVRFEGDDPTSNFQWELLCGKDQGSLKKIDGRNWTLQCPSTPTKGGDEVKWVQAKAIGLSDRFSRDDRAEALWVNEKGRTRVVIVDHHLESILERPSFFIQQAAALLPEFHFQFQPYSPILETLGPTDIVIWFDPQIPEDLKPVAERATLVTWKTSDQVGVTQGADRKLNFRQTAFSVASDLLCCEPTGFESFKVLEVFPTLKKVENYYQHSIPLAVPQFRLPLSTAWPAYLYELLQTLRNTRGVRIERWSESWSRWPLHHLAQRTTVESLPRQGLEPGYYRVEDQLYLHVPTPDGEQNDVFVSNFQIIQKESQSGIQAGDDVRSFWLMILLCLIVEMILSLKPLKASLLLVLVSLSPDLWAKGSEIGALPNDAIQFQTAYDRLRKEVSRRTSIELEPQFFVVRKPNAREPLNTPYFFRSCQGVVGRSSLSSNEWRYFEKIVQLDGVVTFDGCQKEGAIPLASDHPLFKSFYLIGSRTGCGLEQVLGDGNPRNTKFLSFPNGLLRNAFSNETDPCTEGWIRLSVNWILYLFSSDYKSDNVHLPFLLERIR